MFGGGSKKKLWLSILLALVLAAIVVVVLLMTGVIPTGTRYPLYSVTKNPDQPNAWWTKVKLSDVPEGGKSLADFVGSCVKVSWDSDKAKYKVTNAQPTPEDPDLVWVRLQKIGGGIASLGSEYSLGVGADLYATILKC